MDKPLLSILIPTYNRAAPLMKNLYILKDMINNLKFNNLLEVIISDNNSYDDTQNKVNKFIGENKNINISYYRQNTNLGLESNAKFCLDKSFAKYVMFLGDDDYISQYYLKEIMRLLEKEHNVSCIVPSCQGIDIEGNKLKNVGRDLDKNTKRYGQGFNSAKELMIKGHQLSGVTFLRKGTLQAYENKGESNIYPFIFFVGFNCLRGNCIHLTDFPVKITEGAKKFWNYGDDGLLNEIFKNTYMLFSGQPQKQYMSEMKILEEQPWRYKMYFKKNFNSAFKLVKTILSSKYITLQTKRFFVKELYNKINMNLPLINYVKENNVGKVLIFGASDSGNSAFNYINELNKKFRSNIKIIGFLDNDRRKWGEKFCGEEIFEPDMLIKNYGKIIIASHYKDEIKRQLFKMGVANNRIIILH